MPLLRILDESFSGSITPEHVAAVVAATELFEVRLDEIHAGPVGTSGPEMEIQLTRGEPGFAYVEDQEVLLVRLEHGMRCIESGQTENPTSIRAHHIVAFNVTEELEVHAAALSAWIETNVYFLAYPYIRQFFTEITSSLGLPPVVLGYMKRDEWPLFDHSAPSNDSELEGVQ